MTGPKTEKEDPSQEQDMAGEPLPAEESPVSEADDEQDIEDDDVSEVSEDSGEGGEKKKKKKKKKKVGMMQSNLAANSVRR